MQIIDVKPVKVGNSYYFTIPKQYINNGIILVDKKYDLLVTEKKVINNESNSPQ